MIVRGGESGFQTRPVAKSEPTRRRVQMLICERDVAKTSGRDRKRGHYRLQHVLDEPRCFYGPRRTVSQHIQTEV